MLLALDIGNTQISFGLFDGSTLRHHWRAETKASRTADEYASLLFPLLDHAGIGIESLTAVALCSVVPAADFSVKRFSKLYLKHEAFVVDAKAPGLRLNVDFPSEVGADRLANAAYATHHLKLPAVVVDIGTATTFDVVGEGGVYEGGIILPGMRVAVEALGLRTSKLPVVDLSFPPNVIGKNTISCIQSGILYGYVELIDGLLRRLEKELDRPTIVLTGGMGGLLRDRLAHKAEYLPNLTLEGIELLYRRARH